MGSHEVQHGFSTTVRDTRYDRDEITPELIMPAGIQGADHSTATAEYIRGREPAELTALAFSSQDLFGLEQHHPQSTAGALSSGSTAGVSSDMEMDSPEKVADAVRVLRKRRFLYWYDALLTKYGDKFTLAALVELLRAAKDHG